MAAVAQGLSTLLDAAGLFGIALGLPVERLMLAKFLEQSYALQC
jgi:hypothetical protein